MCRLCNAVRLAGCACAQEFVPRLFRGAHIECLFQGNLRAADAADMAAGARATVSDGVLLASQRPRDAVTRLPPGCALLHRCALRAALPRGLRCLGCCLLCQVMHTGAAGFPMRHAGSLWCIIVPGGSAAHGTLHCAACAGAVEPLSATA
jgi:hypothetical protein